MPHLPLQPLYGKEEKLIIKLTVNTKRKSGLTIFSRDFFSLLGLLWIIFAFFISVFAYIIIPDTSPDADQQFPELALLPPGAKINFLHLPEQTQPQTTLKNTFFGTPVKDQWIPVELSSDRKTFFQYGTSETIQRPNVNLILRTYLLGTDRLGRDVFSRLILGTRTSMFIGTLAVCISLLIGVVIGAIAGYFKGWIDQLLSWIMNVLWTIPTLLMVLLLALVFGKGITTVFIAVGLTMWVDVARMVRGQMLSLREKEFAEAGIALGYSSWRIIFIHLLPNTIPSLLVIAASNFASAILVEAGLSFLGFGVQPPTPTWGNMIEAHKSDLMTGMPWLPIAPALCIVSLVLAFTFAGQGLKSAFIDKNSPDE